MRDWQPIETARKDNKAILVWCPENKCQYMATWNDGWFIFGGFTRLTRDVTHWRELPSSPEVEPQPQQPLREILPPVKKVVERLWISHAKQTAQDAAEYLECWLPCDEQLVGEGDWIRTDRTREVEQ